MKLLLLMMVFLAVPIVSHADEGDCASHPCPHYKYELIYRSSDGEILGTAAYDAQSGASIGTDVEERAAGGSLSRVQGVKKLDFKGQAAGVVRDLVTPNFTRYFVDPKSQQIRRKTDSISGAGTGNSFGINSVGPPSPLFYLLGISAAAGLYSIRRRRRSAAVVDRQSPMRA